MSIIQMIAGRAITGSITAGTSGGAIGFSTGLSAGSITPSSLDINGFTIDGIYDLTGLWFTVVVSGIATQTLFGGITINGTTYKAASADAFLTGSGFSQWRWNSPLAGLVNTNSYSFVVS